jgi:hypothetical protein
MARARQRYAEGDWFAVPLGDGTYALGRIARHHRGIVFAYFFSPAFDHVPTLDEVGSRPASKSTTQMLLSHMDLRDGDWPVLGQAGSWDPAAWPMVEFERLIETTGRPDVLYVIRWDEDTLTEEASSVRIDPGEAGKRPADLLSGAGAAVVRLRRALGRG